MDRNTKVGVATLALLSIGFATTAPASADTLLFDRGLPTANLNNGAGSDRSNVAWGEGASGEVTPPTMSMGENFALDSGPNSYLVNSVTVWVIDNGSAGTPSSNSYQLWLGADTNPGAGSTATVTKVATTATVTPVTYSDGSIYQNSSGTFSDIYEVDFTGLDLNVGPGTYAFSVSGLSETAPNAMLTPFLSASNAALGGSNQIAGDGYLYAFDSGGNMDTANGYPDASIGGWDKTSDIDVVVEGTAVPEPTSLAILAAGLAGFGALRRRKRG